MTLFAGLFQRGEVGEHAPAGQVYRPDIDGLRAIAVLPVLAFHAGLTGFGGGFVGVDVFFVISGYLIGQILLRDIDARKFSLIAFYERRIRRILPALMVMMLITVAAAAFLFMPRDFKELGESGLAASTFLSNVYFYLRADYFDTSAHYKPLLHTWSLAVEEQYYVVFPLLLWTLKRYAPKAVFNVIAALALLSLAFGIYQTENDPSGALYLPFSRMWELLLGALLAMRPQTSWSNPARNGAAWLGLALILTAVFWFTEETPFPGAAALLPCVGAALIIGAQSRGGAAALLSSMPMRAVGLISYSLYLWHWPVMSLLRYYYQRDVPIPAWLAAGAAIFVISYLSWRFIEEPVRKQRSIFTRTRLFWGAALASAAFIGFGVVDFATRGLPQRFPDSVTTIANATFDTNPLEYCDQPTQADIRAGKVCTIGVEAGAPTFALIGDSMGNSIMPGVDAAARDAGRSGIALTYSGCYSLVETRQNTDFCSRQIQAAIDYLNRTPSITNVMVINRWSSAAEGSRFGEDIHADWNFLISDADSTELTVAENRNVLARALGRTLEALAPRRVTIVAFVPEQPFDVPRRLGLQMLLGRPLQQGVSRESFEQRQNAVREIFTAAADAHAFEVIDLTDALCQRDVCRVLTPDGAPLYSDDNHISRTGALWLAPLLRPALAPPDQNT